MFKNWDFYLLYSLINIDFFLTMSRLPLWLTQEDTYEIRGHPKQSTTVVSLLEEINQQLSDEPSCVIKEGETRGCGEAFGPLEPLSSLSLSTSDRCRLASSKFPPVSSSSLTNDPVDIYLLHFLFCSEERLKNGRYFWYDPESDPTWSGRSEPEELHQRRRFGRAERDDPQSFDEEIRKSACCGGFVAC